MISLKKYIPDFHSITQRIVLLLILIILPFNIISVITTVISLQNAREQVVISLDNLMGLSFQQLSGRLTTMNDFFYNLDKTNKDFRLYSKQEERNTQLAMAEVNLAVHFNSAVENSSFADVLFWRSGEYERTYIGMRSLNNEKCGKVLQCKNILKSYLETGEKDRYSSWGIARIEEMTWLLKVYRIDELYYGSLISLDELEYHLKEACSYSGLEVSFTEERTRNTISRGRLLVEKECVPGGFWMQVSVPVSESYANLSVFQILCFGFAFLYILLIPLLICLIHRMVLNPLTNVSRAMEHLRNGEQDYRMAVDFRDAEEFTAINETFNDMADRIRELRIANYEKELEKQRIELRNLQLQIRPHFLMNMFHLLYSFAQIENYQNIQKLALYLSEYFRYIFQSGKELQPFSMELDLIQKYLEIADMRYPDCFETVYEVDPEVLETSVPPLLIHNFVENIFKHIIGHDKKIQIRIEAYTDGEESTFMIADDGPGMDAQRQEDINQGIFRKRDDERMHVGIENSYRRIKFFYGERGSLTVVSEPGEGTCFTIIIPFSPGT